MDPRSLFPCVAVLTLNLKTGPSSSMSQPKSRDAAIELEISRLREALGKADTQIEDLTAQVLLFFFFFSHPFIPKRGGWALSNDCAVAK